MQMKYFKKYILFDFFFLSYMLQVARSNSTCIVPENFIQKQIIGIDVHIISKLPHMIAIQKGVCVGSGPSIIVKVHDMHFNLLNTTISENMCKDFLEATICPKISNDKQNICQHANKIVFGILQKLPTCVLDNDCGGKRDQYFVPGISCQWQKEMQSELCPELLLKLNSGVQIKTIQCEADDKKSTRIRNACSLTDERCIFLVKNIMFMCPFIALTIFVFSYLYIILECCSKNNQIMLYMKGIQVQDHIVHSKHVNHHQHAKINTCGVDCIAYSQINS